MNVGDIVHAKKHLSKVTDSLTLYRHPTFLGGCSYLLPLGALGLVVRAVHYEDYGTSVLLLCGGGITGWTHWTSLEVVKE